MAPNRNPNGKQLLTASLALFRQDTGIAALPVLAIGSSTATLIIIGGGLGGLLTAAGVTSQISFIISIGLALVLTMFLTTFFGVAVVFAAADRIEGGSPTVSSCLHKAWGRKGIIFGWALLSAVVGTVLNLIQDKVPFGEVGIAVLVGGIVAAASGHHNTAVVIGGLALAAAGLLIVVAVSIYASVVQVYLRTILYRFATGQSVPDLGVDLAAAFPAASL